MLKNIKTLHCAKVVFFICLFVSIGLIVSGFFVPPMGIIDGSILTATGILWGFASLAVAGRAIDLGRNTKIERGNTVLTINDNNNEEAN